MALTGGECCRPERPAAVAQPHVTMHPRVLSEVPHDNRTVHSSGKQQEGLTGAQAAARDLQTHRKPSIAHSVPVTLLLDLSERQPPAVDSRLMGRPCRVVLGTQRVP